MTEGPEYAKVSGRGLIRQVDVVVVGAGLSGLQAAADVHNAGLSCVVLEAKDRVGGKTRSTTLKHSAGKLDLGAAWISDTLQPKMYALFQKFGLQPIIQPMEGDEVFRMKSTDPPTRTRWPARPAVSSEQRALFDRIADEMDAEAKRIDLHDSTANTHIEDVSIAEWLRSKGATGFSFECWSSWLHDLTGVGPEDIGIVYWLDYVKSAGGIVPLLSDGPDGGQYMRNRHGNQTISQRLAAGLAPDSVYLNSPVTSITQTDGGVLVETLRNDVFYARKALVSVPTPLYKRIRFMPALPADKQEYVDAVQLGPFCKFMLVYASPWWRAAGFNGSFSDLSGPFIFSRDVSSDEDGMFALGTLIGGKYAEAWCRLPAAKRETVIKDQIAAMVGEEHAPKAYDTIETIEQNWTKEHFIEGVPCPMPAPGGYWPRLGNALRRPFGNLHFIGTETAIEWKGYMEGAVGAGERGAVEVIGELQGQLPGKMSKI